MYKRWDTLLPQELVDAIIDEIPVEETLTLQACTLVAQSFYSRAHKRLFSTAVLRSSRYTHHRAKFDPYARFFHYMARTPNDASQVTDLRLHDFYLPISGSWLTEDEVLVPAILNLLPNLESLAINCLDTSLSRAIMASLRKLIATPKLLNISFSKVLFRRDSLSFLSLFKDSVAPKNIQVHGGLKYYEGIDDLPSTGVNPINSLAINMYPSAATDFVDCLLGSRCPLDLLTLKRLEIFSMWMKNAGIFNRLLRHLKDSLEELVVHTTNTSARPIELGRIPKIECHVACKNTCPPQPPLVALAKIFGTSTHHLEYVEMHLRLAYAYEWDVSQGEALDDIMAQVKHQVQMFIVVEGNATTCNMAEQVKASLPKLSARGIFNVETRVIPTMGGSSLD
ncbi:hypothetical protein BDZ89DRAFT_1155421 [Hymenopellis radicata]|nr:hypothetical protein BDZ89DRAFT_1155421 [Hymenopellis radicata]